MLKTFDIEAIDREGNQRWLSLNASSESAAQQEIQQRGLSLKHLHERPAFQALKFDLETPIEVKQSGTVRYLFNAVLYFCNGVLYTLLGNLIWGSNWFACLGIIWFAGSFLWYRTYFHQKDAHVTITKYGLNLFPTGRIFWEEIQHIHTHRKMVILFLTNGKTVKIPIEPKPLEPVFEMLKGHLLVNKDK
jgi:hypothetical protein